MHCGRLRATEKVSDHDLRARLKAGIVGLTPPNWVQSNHDEDLRMQRQVKAKSLSVKIPRNEPTTVRLNCVLANEEFLTLELPRYALERFMVQAKRAIEEAPLLSRGRSSG
jgi:hypothetical protein